MGEYREKDLRKVLTEWRDQELCELPGGENMIAGMAKKPLRRRSRCQRAVAVIVALAALCAGFFAVNPKAYAAFEAWIKGGTVEETSPQGDHYSLTYYELPGISDKTAAYRFGWIPDRFGQAEIIRDVPSGWAYAEEYQDEIPGPAWDAPATTRRLGIGYVYLEGDDPKTYFAFKSPIGTELLENGRIETGTLTGEYFVYANDFFDGFWIDSGTGVYFRLTGDVTKEEAFRIIDHVERTQ